MTTDTELKPLDPTNLDRLIANLEDVERAIGVARVHLPSSAPGAAGAELVEGTISIAHALRIARGPRDIDAEPT